MASTCVEEGGRGREGEGVECPISIRTEGAPETHRKVLVSDTHKHTHSLVFLPSNLANCNYARGSVLETLEGRAVM